MRKYKNKAYSLRIDNEMQEKIRNIAKKNRRTMLEEYKIAIEKHIEEEEKKATV